MALISSGMDVVAISRRLGHKSTTTTLRIDTHLFAKLAKDAAAADIIDAAMRVGTKCEVIQRFRYQPGTNSGFVP